MLYIAEYDKGAPVLLDAATDEHALAMLEAHGLDRPMRLHEVQPGTFLLELYCADEDRADYADDELPNPANHSQTGLAFEPFDATAQWLENWLEKTSAATAATEPAPSSSEGKVES